MAGKTMVFSRIQEHKTFESQDSWKRKGEKNPHFFPVYSPSSFGRAPQHPWIRRRLSGDGGMGITGYLCDNEDSFSVNGGDETKMSLFGKPKKRYGSEKYIFNGDGLEVIN
ncbi:hypothetical protein CDAR_120011 [Caerostris darwini]|uniref:Uncharacterized protein n=1 Tax=Caerostris darwini TaxID=1538125 RepID=A0AAV4T541_9ARAC|nr:hypothetical protein CDAR_120011 [Caerostris darwini]